MQECAGAGLAGHMDFHQHVQVIQTVSENSPAIARPAHPASATRCKRRRNRVQCWFSQACIELLARVKLTTGVLDDSYSASLDDYSSMGVLAVAVFDERRQIPVAG